MRQRRIMDAAGLRTADFVVLVEEGSENAAAGIPRGGRYADRRVIIYDPLFLQNIERGTDLWGPMSVMAHEVAHHLLGHSVFGAGSNPRAELDADFYTGFILNRLGSDLQQAQAAIRLIASPGGSSSHPPLHERLEAIALGWKKAREGVVVRADLGAGGTERTSSANWKTSSAPRKTGSAKPKISGGGRKPSAQSALEQLGQARAQGRLTRERRREMETRVQATEERVQEAEAEREQALTELNRSRNRAKEATETADRAFVC